MLKFYTIYYTTYHNGTEITTKSAQTLCDESQVEEWRKTFTWENLTELYYEIGGLACGFNIWDFKRGRIVSFYDGSLFGDRADVKEWKHKELNIEVKCEWHEWSPSIAKILEWHDGEKAIQYLNERNLRIGVDKTPSL